MALWEVEVNPSLQRRHASPRNKQPRVRAGLRGIWSSRGPGFTGRAFAGDQAFAAGAAPETLPALSALTRIVRRDL